MSALDRMELVRGFVEAFESLRKQDALAAGCALQIITGQSTAQSSEYLQAGVHNEIPLWGETHFDRIRQLYCEQKNMWLSVSDIRRATDIGRGAVAQVLYSSHTDCFERKPHASHSRMKVWRLNNRAIKEAKLDAQNSLLASSEVASIHTKEVVQMI